MESDAATNTYLIPQPFDRALKKLRSALFEREVSICTELDLSGRLHRELGLRLAPSRVLFVDCPELLLRAMAFHGPVSVFVPLHVVVTGRGEQTEVHVLNSLRFAGTGVPQSVRLPVYRLQAQVACALQKIGMRQSVCPAFDSHPTPEPEVAARKEE